MGLNEGVSHRLQYLGEPRVAIATADMADNQRKIARSVELHGKLWSVAERSARAQPESHILGLFIESLNEVFDLHEKRIISAIYGRVPETFLFLLLIGTMLTLAMVGYNAGLTGRRSPFTAVVLIGVLGAVMTLVIDLHQPQGGFLKVSQQPITNLLQQMDASISPRPSK